MPTGVITSSSRPKRISPGEFGRSPAEPACRWCTTRSARTRSCASLDCLRPLGLMVSFGNSSGKVTPFDIGILSQKGSLYLTRPTLATYTATRSDLEATAQEVFDVIREGKVKVEIRHTYPLADAAQVHRDLEGRRTVGSIVMIPSKP